MEVLRKVFNTRPNTEELAACKRALDSQSKETLSSLRKVDRALKRNKDITYDIGRAMGAVR